MKSRYLSVFLVLLLVFSIGGLAAPPTRANAAVLGVLTLADWNTATTTGFTQTGTPAVTLAKSFYSVTAPHNVVGVEVKDNDLNVHQDLPNVLALAQAVDILGGGTGGTTIYTLHRTPVADRNGSGALDAGDISVISLQSGGTFFVGGFPSSTQLQLQTAPPELPTASQKFTTAAAVTADVAGVALTTGLTAKVAQLKVSVVIAGGGSLGANGVTIRGTSVNLTNLVAAGATLGNSTTAPDSEIVLANAAATGSATTTKFWVQGTVTFDIDFNAATITSVTIDEVTTVAALYQFDTQEDILASASTVTITSGSAAAVGAQRAITLREAAVGTTPAASSGVFRATVILVDSTGNACFAPSTTANGAAGCADTVDDNKYPGGLLVKDGDTITVTYNDASNASALAAVVTSTAKVDMAAPTITLVSPTASTTGISTIFFTVNVTDVGAGVDDTTIQIGKTSGTAPNDVTMGNLPGTLSPGGTATVKSPIANGFQATVVASAVTDQRITWAVRVADKVGNLPKFANDVDPTVDFCGNNALKGTIGNTFSVSLVNPPATTTDNPKLSLNSARTGLAGAIDTRLQEAVVTQYPDLTAALAAPSVTNVRTLPAGLGAFAAAPYPGQPVNCTTTGKLADDANVKLIVDPADATKKISDPTMKGTARNSVKVIVNTGAAGRMTLDKSTIALADFSVGGVTPTKIDIGPATSGVGQSLYLTLPLALATDATPEVLLLGAISDSAGNAIDPATLTDAQKALNLHRIPTATDGLAPVVTAKADGVTVGANVARDKFTLTVDTGEGLQTLTIAACLDANNDKACTGGEVGTVPAPADMALVALNQQKGTLVVPAGATSAVHVDVTGTDGGGNNGKTTLDLEGDTKVNNGAAPTVSPANDSTVTGQSPWITVTFAGETGEYTGDTHKTVTLTSATLDGTNVKAKFFTADSITYTMATTGLSLASHVLEIGFKDEAGNTSTAGVVGTTKFTFTVAAKAATEIALGPGWNLVSVPGALDDPSVSSVFAGMVTVQRVYGFDATVGWQLSIFDAATGKWSGSLAELRDGKGYWVFSTGAAPIKVFTAERQPTTPLPQYELKAGWNLIGFSSLANEASTPVDAYTASLGAGTAKKWTSLVSFSPNPAVGYQTAKSNAVFSAQFDAVAAVAQVMRGKGYWIFLTSDGVLAP